MWLPGPLIRDSGWMDGVFVRTETVQWEGESRDTGRGIPLNKLGRGTLPQAVLYWPVFLICLTYTYLSPGPIDTDLVRLYSNCVVNGSACQLNSFLQSRRSSEGLKSLPSEEWPVRLSISVSLSFFLAVCSYKRHTELMKIDRRTGIWTFSHMTYWRSLGMRKWILF